MGQASTTTTAARTSAPAKGSTIAIKAMIAAKSSA